MLANSGICMIKFRSKKSSSVSGAHVRNGADMLHKGDSELLMLITDAARYTCSWKRCMTPKRYW